MKKRTLAPENLRVDSFPTEALFPRRPGTVQARVTRPECANTVYDTCNCAWRG